MAQRFWVGGNATWNNVIGTRWSATSGTAGGASVPLAGDDVFFDANSGAVTVTMGSVPVCRSITCTGFTGTLAFGTTGNISVGDSVGGTVTFSAGMSITNTSGTITLVSTASLTSFTFISAGLTIPSLIINTGTLTTTTLGDNLTASSINLTQGILNLNGKTVNTTSFSSNGSNARALGSYDVSNNPLTSALNLTTNSGSAWDTSSTTGLSFSNANLITVNIPDTGIGGKSLNIGTGSYPLNFNVPSGGSGTITFTIAGTVVMNSLKIVGPKTIQFLSISAATISCNVFNVNGTSGNVVTITDSSSHTTLTQTSGIVSCDFLNITTFPTSGGASFYAGANSVDGGGNTGWIFTKIPTGVNVMSPINKMVTQAVNRSAVF